MLKRRIMSHALLAVGAISACQDAPPATPEAHARAVNVTAAVSALSTKLNEGEMMAVASSLLPTYLKAIPAERREDFGFHSDEEIAGADLGRPFAVFRVEEGSRLTFMDHWRIPILVGQEARAFLDVATTSNGYAVVGFGSASFAPFLQKKATRLGMSILGASNNAAILRTYSSKRGYINEYLACPGSEFLPLGEIRAQKISYDLSSSSNSTSKGVSAASDACQAVPEIVAQIPTN